MSSRYNEWSEHLDGFSTHHGYSKLDLSPARSDDLPTLLWEVCQVPLLLIIIGIFSALVSYFLNFLVGFGNSFRWATVTSLDDYQSWFLFCLWSVVFSLLSCFFTRTICREAAGSGLPEMKTILSGTIKPVLLSFRLIFAKIGGLALALIAGLSVGKEGPLVQVSGAIADQVMKLSIFKNIHRQDARRLEIIACACASGVAATFGTSYGSVLFSIELTSSAYLVRTLPKAFLASVFAMLVFFVLDVSDQLALFNEDIQSQSVSPQWQEIVAFVSIGVASGLLGVVFVWIVEFLSTMRNRFLDATKYSIGVTAMRSYALVGLVSFVTAFFRYYECATVPQTGHGVRTLFDYLFQDNDMSPILGQLVLYFVYKFLATAFSVTLPLPVGLFTPIFLTGGVFGRVVGEYLSRYASFSNYFPWEYSVLGAAGLATGVTRAMSTAVIVYELAGQPHLRLPLSIVVLTAYFVGNRFSKMVYEVLIDTNGTPYMQEIPKALYNVPVAKVMLPINASHVLALDSTYQQAEALLAAMDVASELIMAPDGSGMVELTSLHDGVTSAYHRGTSATSSINPHRSMDTSTVPQTMHQPSLNPGELSGAPLTLASRTLSIEQPYLEPREAVSSASAASTTVFSRFFSNSLTSPVSSSRYMAIPSTETAAGVDPVASVRQPFTRRGSVAGGGLMTAGLLAEPDDYEASAASTYATNPVHSAAAAATASDTSAPAETLPSTYQRSSTASVDAASNSTSLPTQIKHRIKHYAPNVIPIVKSKRNMVIVGAVLRSDLQRSLKELKRVIDIANTPPIVLGRFEDLSFSEDVATADVHTGEHNDEDEDTPSVFHPSAGYRGIPEQRAPSPYQATTFMRAAGTTAGASSSGLPQPPHGNIPHPLMFQNIHYVIVTDGGRSVIPVATNRHGMVVSPAPMAWNTMSLAVPIDPSPYQIVDTMQLSKVDLLFRMLSLNQAYVTHSGKLVGLVTRASLREYLGQFSKRPMDRLAQLAHALWVAIGQCLCSSSPTSSGDTPHEMASHD